MGLEVSEFMAVGVFDIDDDGDDESKDVIVYMDVVDGVCDEAGEEVWVTVCSGLDDWLKVVYGLFVGGFEPVFVYVCDWVSVCAGVADFVSWGDLVFVELWVGVAERRGV